MDSTASAALAATAGDLVDGEGRTISAGQIQLDLADTIGVWPAGSVSLNVHGSPCPKARPTASIRARLRFCGQDAETCAPLTASSR